jgi:hypothetical protein
MDKLLVLKKKMLSVPHPLIVVVQDFGWRCTIQKVEPGTAQEIGERSPELHAPYRRKDFGPQPKIMMKPWKKGGY